MKFFTVAALFTAGAVAAVQGGDSTQSTSTVEVTEYTTYCPSAAATETPGSASPSGPYTVTRPLITTTVTRCKACSSSATVAPSSSTSVPVIPTSAGPSGVAPTGSASSTTATPPAFTGGASRAAAGAGAVAGLFGVVAALL